MKISVLYGNKDFKGNPGCMKMISTIEAAGNEVYVIELRQKMQDDTALMLSVGGDGTYLEAVAIVAGSDVPVLGVNLGRVGFLSENSPEAVAEAVLKGTYHIKERAMIIAEADGKKYAALNEICVSRRGSSMLGVTASVDGRTLPTYWADGLLIATPSGSTAYSLSAGGPIVLPSSKVLIITPVAPHNLNVRPLIVPFCTNIKLTFSSREDTVKLSADNVAAYIPRDSVVEISLAQFSLKRACLEDSSFIQALSNKLFWGEDLRNAD